MFALSESAQHHNPVYLVQVNFSCHILKLSLPSLFFIYYIFFSFKAVESACLWKGLSGLISIKKPLYLVSI